MFVITVEGFETTIVASDEPNLLDIIRNETFHLDGHTCVNNHCSSAPIMPNWCPQRHNVAQDMWTLMRTYKRTHPWITFSLDLRNAPHGLWILLGEACSKAEHLANVPLLPSVAAQLHKLYLVKGALGTTQIEGNTLTEDQARGLIEGTLSLPESKEYLGQEFENIVDACNLIGNYVLSGGTGAIVRIGDILAYNQIVLRDLPREEHVIPGKIRSHEVTVGRYRGAPAEDCLYLLEELCDFVNTGFNVDGLPQKAIAILRAIVLHIYIAWIHPFGDGNGRTARLLEFQVLLTAGVPSTAAHLFSNHYNLTRTNYYRELDHTSRSAGRLESFIQYALRGFVDGLREQIDLVKGQQIRVHWRHFVFDTFRDLESNTDVRRRHLVLDLTDKAEPVPLPKIRHVSTRIAEAYADKTEKTIKRDLQLLAEMGLVVRTSAGYKPTIERMTAFMPQTADFDPSQVKIPFPQDRDSDVIGVGLP